MLIRYHLLGSPTANGTQSHPMDGDQQLEEGVAFAYIARSVFCTCRVVPRWLHRSSRVARSSAKHAPLSPRSILQNIQWTESVQQSGKSPLRTAAFDSDMDHALSPTCPPSRVPTSSDGAQTGNSHRRVGRSFFQHSANNGLTVNSNHRLTARVQNSK